jgi:hypothetical protein
MGVAQAHSRALSSHESRWSPIGITSGAKVLEEQVRSVLKVIATAESVSSGTRARAGNSSSPHSIQDGRASSSPGWFIDESGLKTAGFASDFFAVAGETSGSPTGTAHGLRDHEIHLDVHGFAFDFRRRHPSANPTSANKPGLA